MALPISEVASTPLLDLFTESAAWPVPTAEIPLTLAEIEPWLRLLSTDGIGAVTALKLLARFGLPQQIFAAAPAELHAVLGPKLADALLGASALREERVQASLCWAQDGVATRHRPDHRDIDRDVVRHAPARHLIALIDPRYPRRLLDLADPPPLLYVLGDPSCLQLPSVAIVGSRHATRGGRVRAEELARALREAGWTVVSGLATGIDTAAHRGALLDGAGSRADSSPRATTLAVVGNGLDSVYPAGNRALAAEIARSGAILSEQPPGALPLPQHFPRRNRMIAALAHGVLVIEAARQSGSLITARLAAEIGREVFATPGSIDAPLAKGCHALIKQGAKLVEGVDDVLDELPAIATDKRVTRSSDEPRSQTDRLSDAAESILDVLGWDPVDVEAMARLTPVPTAQLNATLLVLELDGRIERLADGRYRRMPDRQARGLSGQR